MQTVPKATRPPCVGPRLVMASVICTSALAFVAGSLGPSLDWSAPEECPSAEEVLAMASRHSTIDAQPIHADARVERTPDGYRLRLTIPRDGDAHVREVQAVSCQAVAEAAALLVSLAAEHGATPPEQGDGLVPVPVPPDVPPIDDPLPPPTPASNAGVDTAASEPVPAPRQEPAVSGFLRAEGLLQALKLLPKAGPGAGLSAGIRGRRWRVEARGRYVFARPVDYPAPIRGGADVSLWTVGVAACYEPGVGRFSAPVCGGMAAGQMRAEGRDVSRPGGAAYPFAEATAGAALTFALVPRVALTVGAEGAASIVRPRYHIEDRPRLFRAGPGSVRALGGLEVRFP